MKVLLTKPFFEKDLQYIKARLHDNIELIIPSDFQEESLISKACEADILFGGFISEKLLQASIVLKFIQIPWTGVDNLNFDLLKKYKVTVCNSHSNATIVAEHAVTLMLDASKKISYHDRLLREGNWNRVKPEYSNEINPFSKLISGSHVGIIGFGAVGKKIYSLLQGFKCSFKVFTKNEVDLNKDYSKTNYFQPSDISHEAYDLDVIFVCVPLTKETMGSINTRFLSSMNPKAILVNISRGEVILEADLYNALKQKIIAFAAIDTWFNYPKINNEVTFPSLKYDYHLLNNLVLSPHRAGYAEGSFPHLDDAIENLNRSEEGRDLINIVSLTNKY